MWLGETEKQWQDVHTLWTKKTPKCFLSYLRRNLADPNKIWCVLSWVNSPYSDVNVLHLTWITSLHYSVKLSIHILWTIIIGTVNQKNASKCFCRIKKITFSHLVDISIVDINISVTFLNHSISMCVKNFKFKAMHSRRLCHLPAKHECYILQDSVETVWVKWKAFNHVTANLIRKICIKFYQNRPHFVEDTTKTFLYVFRFTVTTAVQLHEC